MATTIPNIVNSLTGSTLDIQKLATDLVAASRAPQQAAINAKLTKTNAVISSVGKIVSAASTMKQYLALQHGDPMALAYLPLKDSTTNTTFIFHPSSPARAVDFSFKINHIATTNSVTLPGMTDSELVDAGKAGKKLNIYYPLSFQAGIPATINGTDTTPEKQTIALQSSFNVGDVYRFKLPIADGSANGSIVEKDITITDASLADLTDKLNSAGFGVATFSIEGGKIVATYNANGSVPGEIAIEQVAVGSGIPSISMDLSQFKTMSDLQAEIKDRIGYDASLVSSGGDTPTYDLTISRGTGQKNKFSFKIMDGISSEAEQVSSGVDARVSVGSKSYTSYSNTFSDLVPDLIINLDPATSTIPSPTVRIKTEPNTTKTKQVLLDVIDGYNNLLAIINNEIKYDKDISKRGGLNNNSIARTFLWQMRELTTASIKISNTRSVSLADVGVSTNLDGTLRLDEAKLGAVIASKPGLLESVVSSNVVNGSKVKGALQRILDMTDIIVAPTSSFNTLAQKAQKVDLPKIELEVTKLDDQMTALQEKYLKQFSAMQTAVQSSKNTQDSLTQSMASWSAGLKG